MIKIYPKLKEKYGMNSTLEKLLSFIFVDNDYNYEPIRNILDNYYNGNNKIKEDEYINLKEKND